MEPLQTIADSWTWWLVVAGVPLILTGALVGRTSKTRTGGWRLGRVVLRLGVGMVLVAAFLGLGLPLLDGFVGQILS